MPEEHTRYQILGGFHRWKIACELKYESVPCAVVQADDRRAKILSVNLNEMKGQPSAPLLADLMHDLNEELSIPDLASQLPLTETDVTDLLALMKIPDGLESTLDAEAEAAERARPQVLSFVVDSTEEIEEALLAASKTAGGLTRGRALIVIAQAFLEAQADPPV